MKGDAPASSATTSNSEPYEATAMCFAALSTPSEATSTFSCTPLWQLSLPTLLVLRQVSHELAVIADISGMCSDYSGGGHWTLEMQGLCTSQLSQKGYLLNLAFTLLWNAGKVIVFYVTKAFLGVVSACTETALFRYF